MLWVLCGAVSGIAQTIVKTPADAPGFVVREWHLENGLPQEDVFQIFQDSKGFLWIACRGVVSRFDGTAFHAYAAAEARQTFHGIVEDADGSLLLTPRNGDPVRFRDGVFTKEPLPAPYSGLSIGYVMDAPDGARWFSVSGGVLRLNGGVTEFFGEKEGISDQGWARFAIDGEKRFWICAHDRLLRYEGGRLVPVEIPAGATELRVASSRMGGPWLITTTRVLKLGADGQWETVGEIPPLIGPRYINACFEGKNGELWLGTRSLGIHVFARGRLTHVPTASETVMALVQDRDGMVWAGANTGGLSAIAPKIHALHDKQSGLTTIAVLSVCEDIDGAIWIANGDGGVARVRGTQVDKWTLSDDGKVFGARSVSAHPEGGVWAVGSTHLFRVRGDSERVELFQPLVDNIHPILYSGRNGDLWFTTTDRRIGRLREGRCEYFRDGDGVAAAGVRSFYETDDGVMLVGTNDGRLLKREGTRFVPAFGDGALVSGPINV